MVTFNETQARIFQYLRRHPLSTTSTMVDHAVGLSGWEIDMGLQRLRHAGLIESGPKILARGRWCNRWRLTPAGEATHLTMVPRTEAAWPHHAPAGYVREWRYRAEPRDEMCEWCWAQAQRRARLRGGAGADRYREVMREQAAEGARAECPVVRAAMAEPLTEDEIEAMRPREIRGGEA